MKKILLVIFLWMLVIYSGPFDGTQGISSKFLYMHVPSVWIAYLAYSITFTYSIRYLYSNNPKFDSIAVSNAKSGLIFTAITLISGSIWGKLTWGSWWVWGDARLNLTAILFLVYLGYIASRKFNSDLHTTAKNSSYIGIFGIVQIPIIHFSVIWWRSIHQQASILSQDTIASGNAPISSDILIYLIIGVVLTTFLHFLLASKFSKLLDIQWENYLNPSSRAKI